MATSVARAGFDRGMRAIVQRVTHARVLVAGQEIGRCGAGFLVLVAAHRRDTEADAGKLADRIAGLRVFADAVGKMNLALADATSGAEPQVLAISNFTVYGDTARSRRPSFTEAAGYEDGQRLFDEFVRRLRASNLHVATGEFGADMQVELVNDGPVTLILDAGPSGDD